MEKQDLFTTNPSPWTDLHASLRHLYLAFQLNLYSGERKRGMRTFPNFIFWRFTECETTGTSLDDADLTLGIFEQSSILILMTGCPTTQIRCELLHYAIWDACPNSICISRSSLDLFWSFVWSLFWCIHENRSATFHVHNESFSLLTNEEKRLWDSSCIPTCRADKCST